MNKKFTYKESDFKAQYDDPLPFWKLLKDNEKNKAIYVEYNSPKNDVILFI